MRSLLVWAHRGVKLVGVALVSPLVVVGVVVGVLSLFAIILVSSLMAPRNAIREIGAILSALGEDLGEIWREFKADFTYGWRSAGPLLRPGDVVTVDHRLRVVTAAFLVQDCGGRNEVWYTAHWTTDDDKIEPVRADRAVPTGVRNPWGYDLRSAHATGAARAMAGRCVMRRLR